MKKDVQKKCNRGSSASPEPDVSSPLKKYIFHTHELKNGKSTVEKPIFGLPNDSPPITLQDAILLLAKSIQEQAVSECKEIMFAGDKNLLHSLLTEGYTLEECAEITLDGEQVSTCKASLDLAGMGCNSQKWVIAR